MKDVTSFLFWYFYPCLIVQSEGICDNMSLQDRPGVLPNSFGFGLIKWKQIKSIEVWSDALGTCAIALTLHDIDTFRDKLSKDLRREFEMQLILMREEGHDFHIMLPFPQELDCDILFAYNRISAFVNLQQFRKKRINFNELAINRQRELSKRDDVSEKTAEPDMAQLKVLNDDELTWN